jgi:hypothetical protein
MQGLDRKLGNGRLKIVCQSKEDVIEKVGFRRRMGFAFLIGGEDYRFNVFLDWNEAKQKFFIDSPKKVWRVTGYDTGVEVSIYHLPDNVRDAAMKRAYWTFGKIAKKPIINPIRPKKKPAFVG